MEGEKYTIAERVVAARSAMIREPTISISSSADQIRVSSAGGYGMIKARRS